jgi:hypothetical protein
MSMLWACPRGHYRPRPGDAPAPHPPPARGPRERAPAEDSPPGTCPVCGESLVAFPEYSPPTERRSAGRARETVVRPGPSPHPESPRPAPAETARLPLTDAGEET